MEFDRTLASRRMHRHLSADPIALEELAPILLAFFRAPSAGFAQGAELLVLCDEDDRRLAIDSVTTPGWLDSHPSHSSLLHAPVIVVPLADSAAYTHRYSMPDKAASKLDTVDRWPLPYWLIDTAFATMLLLAKVTDSGLGASFIGIFRGEDELSHRFNLRPTQQPIGLIFIGQIDVDDDGGSPKRIERRAPESRIHLGRVGVNFDTVLHDCIGRL